MLAAPYLPDTNRVTYSITNAWVYFDMNFMIVYKSAASITLPGYNFNIHILITTLKIHYRKFGTYYYNYNEVHIYLLFFGMSKQPLEKKSLSQ